MDERKKRIVIILAVFLLGAGIVLINQIGSLQDRVLNLESNQLLFNVCDVNGVCESVNVAEKSLELISASNSHESRIVAIEAFLNQVSVESDSVVKPQSDDIEIIETYDSYNGGHWECFKEEPVREKLDCTVCEEVIGICSCKITEYECTLEMWVKEPPLKSIPPNSQSKEAKS